MVEGELNAIGSVGGMAAYIKWIGTVAGNRDLEYDEGNGEC